MPGIVFDGADTVSQKARFRASNPRLRKTVSNALDVKAPLVTKDQSIATHYP